MLVVCQKLHICTCMYNGQFFPVTGPPSETPGHPLPLSPNWSARTAAEQPRIIAGILPRIAAKPAIRYRYIRVIRG